MVTEEQIQEIVRRIVAGYAPDRIILFGSYAYGTPTEDSDVDLLVIKADDERGSTARVVDVSMAVWHDPIPWLPAMDVLVLNRAEQQYVMDNRFSVENKALRNGRELYARPTY